MSKKQQDPKEAAIDQAMEAPQVAEEEIKSLNEIRDEACVPVALALLKLIASKEDLYIGMIDRDKAVNYYSNLYVEAVPLFKEHDVKMDDVKYIFQIAIQALQLLMERTDMTLELMYNQTTAMKWGVADSSAVTINMVDEALHELADKAQKSAAEKSTGEKWDEKA